MIITRRWLDNFINLDDISDDKITQALNSLGFEVENYKSYKKLNDDLIIGFVSAVFPMEGTKLNFCFVDIGEELVSPIVTGATNIKEGQYVIVARPEKTIANGVTLAIKKIQGKISEGMIVSLSEIGMQNSSLINNEITDWIYEVFTKQDLYTLIGNDNALDIIGFNDSVWEISLTLNRSDALGSLQVAKELANYFKKQINFVDEPYKISQSKNKITTTFELDNSDKIIRSLAIQQFDIKELLSFDKRILNIYSNQDIWLKFNEVKTSLNFWLDLSNIIAIETGQPVIFLDPKKITKKLSIKNNPNQTNQTNLQLMHGDEVISTLGVDFNIDFLPTLNDDSAQVLLVILSLDPYFMRKQQKSFNMSNISLQRWMKPISSKLYNLTAQRTIFWLNEYNLLSTASSLDVLIESEEKENIVNVDLKEINNLLGIKLSFQKIQSLFKKLDFEIKKLPNNIISFKIDNLRTDITHQAHIIEEIARLYGYNNIKSEPPIIESAIKSKNFENKLKIQIENYLIGLGFNNVKTYSLMNKKEVEAWDLFNIKNPLNLISPLSKLRETYRLSISKSLIEIATLNYAKGNKNIKLYEFGDIYNKKNVWKKHLSFLISGDVIFQKAYNIDIKPNYSYAKGILDEILKFYQLNWSEIEITTNQSVNNDIHPYINGCIKYHDEILGFIYKLNPHFEKEQKLDETYIVELCISTLEKFLNPTIKLNEIPKFQKTSRDVTMLLEEKHKYNQIINSISKNINFISNIYLFDIYQDHLLKQEQKTAISIKVEFNSTEQQLSDEIIAIEWKKMLKNISDLNIKIK